MASDAEIDRAAKVHALRHGVSYSEALNHVVASFSAQPSFAEVRPASGGGSGLSDAEVHRKAMIIKTARRMPYYEAVKAVVELEKAGQSVEAGQFSASCEFVAVVQFGEAASMLEGQWLDIFKSGAHIDDSGTQHVFSEQDIQDIAAGYRPAVREAPLVIGHPATDGPAHGWVRSLRVAPGGVLQIQAKQVSPEFAELVKDGRFKKRSSALYPPSHPSNPNPGKWYLRHVGFLGAQPPAVAGLKDPVFS